MTASRPDVDVEAATAAVRVRSDVVPRAAVILGSGLGDAVAGMKVDADIAYADVPGMPPPSVAGHAGRLTLGWIADVPVAAFAGRFHYYEGHDMSVVTLPAQLAAGLGADVLVSSAAVGGLDPALEPGSLVIGRDHLNFIGVDPLRGWRPPAGASPFVDLSDAYDETLAERALRAAEDVGIPATTGVYAAVSGPSFETRAETAFYRSAGASVVGMSVVPEVTAARALGLRVLGIFCVTNRVGAGVTHEEVLRVAGSAAEPFGRVLERVLQEM